jgi:hypothetical protein
MSKLMQYLNFIADPRARKSLRSVFTAGGHPTVEFGETVPANGASGYAPGCEFILPNATLGQSPRWLNVGSVASCLFVPFGPVLGYGFVRAGARKATNTSTTEEIYSGFADADIAVAGHIASDDADYITSAVITAGESSMLITASADPSTTHGYMYGALRSKCVPEWDIFAAGTDACAAATTNAITVSGVLSTDIALAGYSVTDDTDTIAKTVCTTDTVTVTLSTTSSTGHTNTYMVLRPRGTFKPSHYVAYAAKGVATVADASGIATNDITVTGAVTTDIAFAMVQSNAGTVRVVRAIVSAADTLTVQFNADPSTTSTINYFILRAY